MKDLIWLQVECTLTTPSNMDKMAETADLNKIAETADLNKMAGMSSMDKMADDGFDKIDLGRPATPGLGIPMEMTPGQIMEVKAKLSFFFIYLENRH